MKERLWSFEQFLTRQTVSPIFHSKGDRTRSTPLPPPDVSNARVRLSPNVIRTLVSSFRVSALPRLRNEATDCMLASRDAHKSCLSAPPRRCICSRVECLFLSPKPCELDLIRCPFPRA